MSMAELIAYNCGSDARESDLPVDLVLDPVAFTDQWSMGDAGWDAYWADRDGFAWWYQVGWTKADQIARGD